MRKMLCLLILALLVSMLSACEMDLKKLPFGLGGDPAAQPEQISSAPTEPTVPVVTGIAPALPPDYTEQVTTPTTAPTAPYIPPEELQWKPFEAYRQVVNRLRNQEGNNWKYCSYVLYDMDDDGHPELITHRGVTAAETYFEVYTMVKDEAVSVGLIPDGLLGGLCTHPGILSIWGKQGMEEITIYTLNGTNLEAEVIYSDYGKEYHSCQPLTQYGLADETGWNWESNPWDNNASLVDQLRAEKNQPQGFASYVIRVGNNERAVHKQPNWVSEFVMYLPVGNYTIVEEAFDGEILWGKLKSGAGWICLDEIMGYRVGYAPVVITESDGSGNYKRYDIHQNGYARGIMVHFREEVVQMSLYYAPGGEAQEEVLQVSGPLKPGSSVAMYVEFPGDMTEYQLWVLEKSGYWRVFHIYISGYDGSIGTYE